MPRNYTVGIGTVPIPSYCPSIDTVDTYELGASVDIHQVSLVPILSLRCLWSACMNKETGRYFVLQDEVDPPPPVLLRTKYAWCGKYPPLPSSVHPPHRVRACLIVTAHGSISCADPHRPARRSTYQETQEILTQSEEKAENVNFFGSMLDGIGSR